MLSAENTVLFPLFSFKQRFSTATFSFVEKKEPNLNLDYSSFQNATGPTTPARRLRRAAGRRTVDSFITFTLAFYGYLSSRKLVNYVNDPTAGSPTVTLLRLLLPLNDQVWSSFQQHR